MLLFATNSLLPMLLLTSTTVLAAPEALVHQKSTANSLSVNPEIRLVTSVGDEDIASLFQKAKCAECHIIPGIRGANGKVGPRLVMGTAGPKRLKESNYKGTAKTVREYVMESILDHGQYVPRGYRSVPMPLNYNTVLAAGALYKMVDYLSTLEEGHLPPTPPDPCNSRKLRNEEQPPAKVRPLLPPC